MLAIKYREDFTDWPLRIRLNTSVLPEGFDELISESAYELLLETNQAAYDAFKALQAAQVVEAQAQAQLQVGAAKFAAVRAKWQNIADRYATENSATGINTAQAASIADAFSSVEKYLRLNVPTKAIAEIALISPIEPYLPQGKINSMRAELLAFIQETFSI